MSKVFKIAEAGVNNNWTLDLFAEIDTTKSECRC